MGISSTGSTRGKPNRSTGPCGQKFRKFGSSLRCAAHANNRLRVLYPGHEGYLNKDRRHLTSAVEHAVGLFVPPMGTAGEVGGGGPRVEQLYGLVWPCNALHCFHRITLP